MPAPTPSPKSQHAHGVARHLPADSALPFGQRGRVGVTLDDHLGVELGLHRILKKEAVEAGKVGGGGETFPPGSSSGPGAPIPTPSNCWEGPSFSRIRPMAVHMSSTTAPGPGAHASGQNDGVEPDPVGIKRGDAEVGASQIDAKGDAPGGALEFPCVIKTTAPPCRSLNVSTARREPGGCVPPPGCWLTA